MPLFSKSATQMTSNQSPGSTLFLAEKGEAVGPSLFYWIDDIE